MRFRGVADGTRHASSTHMARMFDIGFGLLLLTVALGCRDGSTYVDRDQNGGIGGFSGSVDGYGPDLAPPPGGPASSIALSRGDLLWLRTAGSPQNESVIASCAGEDLVAIGRFEGELTFEPRQENETTIGTERAGPSLFVANYERDGWLAWARELGHGSMHGALCRQVGATTFLVGNFAGDLTFELADGEETLTARSESDVFVARLDQHGQVREARVLVEGDATVRGMHCSAEVGCVVAGDFRDTARIWPDQSPQHHDLVSRGERDVFVTPIQVPVGEHAWPAHFGSAGDDRASALAPWGKTPGTWQDDGHFVVGSFAERVYDVPGTGEALSPVGGIDAFVLHLDRQGELSWASSMGGPDHDAAVAVVATHDHLLVGGQFGRGAPEPSYLELEDGSIIDSEGGIDAYVATFELDELGQGTTLLHAYGIGSPGDDIMTSMVPRLGGAFGAEMEGVLVSGQFGGGGPLWFRDEQTDARCADVAGAFVASIDGFDTASPAWTRHYCGARVHGVVTGAGSLHVVGDFQRGTVFGAGEPYEHRPAGAGERDAFVAQLLP